jgi:hypothetical protein
VQVEMRREALTGVAAQATTPLRARLQRMLLGG